MTNFQDLFTSWIRTAVPIVIGSVLAWLASQGVTVDDSLKTALDLVLGGSLSIVYYIVVRFLEVKWPAVGWLLGTPKQPNYTK
jgi:uncharacterized membrane protein (DUF441 family)